MPTDLSQQSAHDQLENLRKQAKQLQRWHRDGYYPVAARIRAGLPAFASSTDAEVMASAFSLSLAQQLIAGEHGFSSWRALQSDWSDMPTPPKLINSRRLGAYPQILTTDFAAARRFYLGQLGFAVVYEYGEPSFYALINRGDARLNLRLVQHHPVNLNLTAEEDVLTANIPFQGVKNLYLELRDRGIPITRTQDFIVTDPDGNRLCFAEAI